MRMIFTCEHDGPFSNVIGRVQHETMNETLSEILEDFELFLKGCGFNFDGKLDIVSLHDYYKRDGDYDGLLQRHESDAN